MVGLLGGVTGPALLTLALLPLNLNHATDYVFLYLALVAVLALIGGLGSALLAAGASFLLVDYFFVPPIHTFTFASEADLVTLVVFFGAAGLVGSLGSRRRAAQFRAEALASALKTANQELERLNVEQAEAAATALHLAQSEQHVRLLMETDRLRRELLASVSHELRTPLASLLTGTTAIMAFDDLDPRVRRRLTALEGEERRLSRLVSDLLDMARIEGQALDLQLRDIDLSEAVIAAVQRTRDTNPDREITTAGTESPLEVVADWDRLAQILDNLIANADRHAAAGTPIEITAKRGLRGMSVTHVVDRGPGVPAELRDTIFERFVRGPAVSNGPAGIGLGLAIVRGLVEAQAGRVWLEDGDGGNFAFSLPLAEGPPSSAGDEDVHIDIGEHPDDLPPRR
jgi:two-component system sensor histidine kinase KdpD